MSDLLRCVQPTRERRQRSHRRWRLRACLRSSPSSAARRQSRVRQNVQHMVLRIVTLLDSSCEKRMMVLLQQMGTRRSGRSHTLAGSLLPPRPVSSARAQICPGVCISGCGCKESSSGMERNPTNANWRSGASMCGAGERDHDRPPTPSEQAQGPPPPAAAAARPSAWSPRPRSRSRPPPRRSPGTPACH